MCLTYINPNLISEVYSHIFLTDGYIQNTSFQFVYEYEYTGNMYEYTVYRSIYTRIYMYISTNSVEKNRP
jgi:hypothetical protein